MKKTQNGELSPKNKNKYNWDDYGSVNTEFRQFALINLTKIMRNLLK